MSRHRIVLSVDIPDNPGITNQDLADYILAASNCWYGQMPPGSEFWALANATWKASFIQDGEQDGILNEPADD